MIFKSKIYDKYFKNMQKKIQPRAHFFAYIGSIF